MKTAILAITIFACCGICAGSVMHYFFNTAFNDSGDQEWQQSLNFSFKYTLIMSIATLILVVAISFWKPLSAAKQLLMLAVAVCGIYASLHFLDKQFSDLGRTLPQTKEVNSGPAAYAHYKNTNPNFSFDYPNLEGYKVTIGPGYLHYDIPQSKLDGPLGAYVEWEQVYVKVPSDYWDSQRVNGNYIKYFLSEDENTLDFRLEKQGTVIRFNVALPGGYLRKKEITETIISSFNEITVADPIKQ